MKGYGPVQNGNAWRHPVEYFRRNGWSVQSLMDAMFFNPINFDVRQFDVAILGSNPVLSCLLAKHLGQRGERIFLGLHDMADGWAYEVLDTPVVRRILGLEVGLPIESTLNEIVQKLAQQAADAIAVNAGIMLERQCFPCQMIQDFDGAYCGVVRSESSNRFDKAQDRQAALLAQVRVNLQKKVKVIGYKDVVRRQRAFVARKVYVTSFDHGLMIPSSIDTNSRLQVRYGDGYESAVKLGSATGFVGEGEPWLRRVIADLVALRNLFRHGEQVGAEQFYFNG